MKKSLDRFRFLQNDQSFNSRAKDLLHEWKSCEAAKGMRNHSKESNENGDSNDEVDDSFLNPRSYNFYPFPNLGSIVYTHAPFRPTFSKFYAQ